MRRSRKFVFRGDELEFLTAMDRAGCVLDMDDRFHCLLENEKLPRNARLPILIKGTYCQTREGWALRYRILPAFRTAFIGGLFLLLLVFSLITNTWAETVLFGILCAAVAVCYFGQYKACVIRFEREFSGGN